MPRYMIVAEKPSARKAFEKALGGRVGSFDNFDYELINLHGHLLGLASPENQMSDQNFIDKVSQWSNTETIPWHLDDFKWKKRYLETRDIKGRKTTTKSEVQKIRQKAQSFDAIVIATDNDPTGEGDVLGHELIEDIGWKKQILRCHFKDESPKEIQVGMKKLIDVSNPQKSGVYQKGLARERFDYATMQLSRLATASARSHSYDVVIRPGRLKSIIVSVIYNQTRARDTFVKRDQFQGIFIDEFKNKFIDTKAMKHDNRAMADNDISKFQQSTITVADTKRKSTSAPKLFNLDQLGVVLGNYGISLVNIKNTYQKMYEANLVSYPRTEDTEITIEQWNQLLDIKDSIARVVDVDPSVLINTQPRKKYVSSKDLSHGANRPGLVVPNSLDEIESQFGRVGRLIYETLAKSYLATMAPDYEYDATQAFVTDYPSYKASKNVPVKAGYKAILKSLEDAVTDKDDEHHDVAEQFGKVAKPTVNVTQTVPPKKPTRKFVTSYLERNNIGTGATRMATLIELMNPKINMMSEKKGVFILTPEGVLSGAVLQNTMLANPKVTAQLFEMMDQIEEFKIPMSNIYKAVTMIINKDSKKMDDNARRLDEDSYLKGKLPPKSRNSQAKFYGVFEPTGERIGFNNSFMNHRFTEDEAASLLRGNTIGFEVTTKKGLKKNITGKLEKQSFPGKDKKKVTYWGIKPNWN